VRCHQFRYAKAETVEKAVMDNLFSFWGSRRDELMFSTIPKGVQAIEARLRAEGSAKVLSRKQRLVLSVEWGALTDDFVKGRRALKGRESDRNHCHREEGRSAERHRHRAC
jgi:hypothetical protein